MIKNILFLFFIFCFLSSILGCDAFVRKFTRKRKTEAPKEPMVLVPQEYKAPQMSKEEVYRQYFLYWRSWHDELINSLSGGANHKKQMDCINEALKNLKQLRQGLQEARQKKLDNYIKQLEDLRGSIREDLYGTNVAQNRLSAERIKRAILREFSYEKVKKYLA